MELTFRLTDSPTAPESVYGLLLDSSGTAFTEADVRAGLDLPKTTTHVALRQLVDEGLVAEERIGRTGRYSVDRSDPLARALKTSRAIRRAEVAIAGQREHIQLAVLFGSASRGDDTLESDLDLLVVTDDPEAVESALSSYPRLHPVVVTPAKHMSLIAEAGTFAKETARGITIWEQQ